MQKNKTNNALPLSKQVEKNLLKYIKENNLEAGVKIPNEATLSKTFKVGRSSLREAIRGLVTRGVLEVRQGSGTFIIDPIPSDIDPLGLRFEKDSKKIKKDLVELLIKIEPFLCERAALNANDKEIKEIIKESTNKESSLSFHLLIAKASKNCIAENLINLFYTSSDIFSIFLLENRKENVLDLQKLIANFIKNKDELKAKLVMQELLSTLYRDM